MNIDKKTTWTPSRRRSVSVALGDVTGMTSKEIDEAVEIFNDEMANKSSVGTCRMCGLTETYLWDSVCGDCATPQ